MLCSADLCVMVKTENNRFKSAERILEGIHHVLLVGGADCENPANNATCKPMQINHSVYTFSPFTTEYVLSWNSDSRSPSRAILFRGIWQCIFSKKTHDSKLKLMKYIDSYQICVFKDASGWWGGRFHNFPRIFSELIFCDELMSQTEPYYNGRCSRLMNGSDIRNGIGIRTGYTWLDIGIGWMLEWKVDKKAVDPAISWF